MGHERAFTNESKQRAPEILKWVKNVTGADIRLTADTMHEDLKDGLVLCELANKIKPKTIKKPNQSKLAFKQMENVTQFINAIRDFGIKEADNFSTIDLYEGKDLNQVIQALESLSRLCHKIPSFKGPYVSNVKEVDANIRDPKSFKKSDNCESLFASKLREMHTPAEIVHAHGTKNDFSHTHKSSPNYQKPVKGTCSNLFEQKILDMDLKADLVKASCTKNDWSHTHKK